MEKYLRSVVVLVLAIFLTGSAAMARQYRSTGDDAKILQDVNKMISEHPSLKSVRAIVDDNIVTLEGTVDLFHDALRAEDMTRKFDKVAGVRNHLQVKSNGMSDAELRDRLADKLRYDRVDRGVVFNNFTLGVNNGVVTLGGNVRNEVDHASALAIVENMPGVRGIVDNVQVAPASIADDELRVRVARAVYGDPVLQKYAIDPEAPIRIVVNNGHVGLYGMVNTEAEKTVALTRAREVPGSFSVDDHLMVASQMPR